MPIAWHTEAGRAAVLAALLEARDYCVTEIESGSRTRQPAPHEARRLLAAIDALLLEEGDA